MSGKKAKRHRAATKLAEGPGKPSRAKKALLSATAFVLLGAIAVCYFIFFQDKPATPVPFSRQAQSLDELLKMTPEQLADVDIAERNLLCATGLRGAEKLDVGKALARLNDWADRVRYWTDQSMWDFRQNPEEFKNSEAKFRVLLLISVVQKDFGVHYNDRGERNCDFSSAKNAFLHGMIDDTNGGTCASMPVMYVAVGRRLGYPMKLVLAKTHIFARWEDPATGERFNIEGTNPRFDDHPDSYYQKWPYPISDAELKQGWYLKPLTPRTMGPSRRGSVRSRPASSTRRRVMVGLVTGHPMTWRQPTGSPTAPPGPGVRSGPRPSKPAETRLQSSCKQEIDSQ